MSTVCFCIALVLTAHLDLCIASCTPTECINFTSETAQTSQLLQNLTAAVTQVLQNQLNIHITHKTEHCNCSSSVEPATLLSEPLLPRDCTEIYSNGNRTSGVYKIKPLTPEGLNDTSDITSTPVKVHCDLNTNNGGWTVIQRRHNGLVDFYRDWEDYKHGFGYVDGDYWLGLQSLHWLTSTGTYELRVDLEDFDGNIAYAQYDTFYIADERLFFKLMIGGYSGTAGDGLARQNYAPFSTRDQNHDIWTSGVCSHEYKGAWWYTSCLDSNLNALYLGPSMDDSKGMGWYKWDNNWKVLKKSEMKIRRI